MFEREIEKWGIIEAAIMHLLTQYFASVYYHYGYLKTNMYYECPLVY